LKTKLSMCYWYKIIILNQNRLPQINTKLSKNNTIFLKPKIKYIINLTKWVIHL